MLGAVLGIGVEVIFRVSIQGSRYLRVRFQGYG